jgi:GNAT superfamily N-acetyltransferase
MHPIGIFDGSGGRLHDKEQSVTASQFLTNVASSLHMITRVRGLASYPDHREAGPTAAGRSDLDQEAHGPMNGVRHQPRALLGQLGRTVTASVFARHWQYITLKHIGDTPDPSSAVLPDGRTECVALDSPEGLDAVAAEICASFRDSVEALRARVARGCVVCVARRRRTDGRGHIVVGYEIAERGVFSALGRRVAVSKDVVFSHYVEVLPAYRGQRIHHLLFSTRDAYFRARGGRVVCGVCAPHNQSSLRALERDGAAIVGTVERISLLRVFVLSYTPIDRIAQLLASAPA